MRSFIVALLIDLVSGIAMTQRCAADLLGFDVSIVWGAICKSLHLHILGQKTALNEMHLSPFANVFAI